MSQIGVVGIQGGLGHYEVFSTLDGHSVVGQSTMNLCPHHIVQLKLQSLQSQP